MVCQKMMIIAAVKLAVILVVLLYHQIDARSDRCGKLMSSPKTNAPPRGDAFGSLLVDQN